MAGVHADLMSLGNFVLEQYSQAATMPWHCTKLASVWICLRGQNRDTKLALLQQHFIHVSAVAFDLFFFFPFMVLPLE